MATAAVLLVTVAAPGLLGLYATAGHDRVPPPALPTPIQPDHEVHAFGNVPLSGGTVQATFTLTNRASNPARIATVWTSCPCVTATLRFGDGTQEGPFGTPAHRRPTSPGSVISPGAEVSVTVRFDPAARGTDGLGRSEHVVRVHTEYGGAMTTLRITADVVRAAEAERPASSG